jgi:hypothetical protein
MALLPRLEKELDELRREHTIEVTEGPAEICIVLRDFGIGPGYNVPSTDLLIRIPKSYPDAAPDMFWVRPDLLLEGGATPQAAESIEAYIGRTWRRFSWHWPPPWNPNLGNLSTFVTFIRRRLSEKK